MLLTALLCAHMAAGAAHFSIPMTAPAGVPDRIPVTRAAKAATHLPPAGGPDTTLTFLVDFRDQLDYGRAGPLLSRARLSRQSQRQWTIAALGAVAARSRTRLAPLLAELSARGEIDSWVGVSVVNRLIVRGGGVAMRALAGHEEVSAITGEVEVEGALQTPGAETVTASGIGASWPLDLIGAKEAWNAGVDGRTVVVGVIDSGASRGHEQLKDNFKGGDAAWFDPLRHTTEPIDVRLGHGTAVLGCAVGRAGEQGISGVAPGATWIAAVGLDEGRYNNALLTRAADWMLNVGRPDVLIVAWRAAGIGCNDSLRTIVNAWRAADIVVVFAAGNGGPAARTDVAPANAAKLFPGSSAALSVGAVDAKANPYAASSRGPSRCSGSVYPQLVAPGADVLVALPAGENLYRRASGTSFAAGYVAGAAALLRQRFPEAHAGEIERALWRSATDLGPRGPDSTFGHGLVSVPRAMDFFQTHLLAE